LAGEVGHFSLNPDGELCSCGNKGCWNTMVNLKSIYRRINQLSPTSDLHYPSTKDVQELQKISFNKVIDQALAGDPIVSAALNDTAKWLGIGIASYINLFNPEFVVIGGPLSPLFEMVQPVIQDEVNRRALPWQKNACQIKSSMYRQDACLIGAIATVIWNLLNNPQYRNRN
jgi:predicted NBD/HSP70 family sugar kinase